MPDGLWLYPLLFGGALVAGWVDAIAGGGGLLTIPLLLSVGLPPQAVLGTNKFQSSFGSFTASDYYGRKGIVPLREAIPGIVFTMIGAAVGAWSVQQIAGDALNSIIPALLLAIAVYMLFTPSLGHRDGTARIPRKPFWIVFGLLLGFYDGFFGPGVGSFWAIALVLGLGFNLTTATGYTKVMNFTSNIVSCLLFLAGGHVMVTAGLVMAAGQIIGARMGAAMVISRGVRFIRPIFMTMVILTTLKLLINRIF